jgi:NAD-dependent SIR2 family protein deacetylase
MPFNELKEAKKIISDCDGVLIIAGAGMSVDSGICTYRGTNGIWNRSIQVGNNNYSYDEISSLKMWKEFPELAWGFKAYFYKMMRNCEPHEGYYKLLDYVRTINNNYFICTSNIDNYFEHAGFDKDKIYEVHGTMKSLQCMDKKCSLRNGIIEMTEAHIPMVDENTLIGSNLPSCPYCSNILRPNVSMFGDYDFYGKPYEFARKKMELWLKENEQNGKKIVILEIGCGINPHSLRMYNGKMMSGEWKLPKMNTIMKTIRLNPDDDIDNTCIQIRMGAKQAINSLLKSV